MPRRTAEIIDAAARVFAERGYHGASTQVIADRLGIRQASLYYYFRSKEAALEAVCALGVEGYVERARAIERSGLGAIEKLSALIRAHLAPLEDRPDYVRVFASQRKYLPTASRRRIGARARAYEQIVCSVIEAGQAANVFRDDQAADRMMLVVLGACNAATTWPWVNSPAELQSAIDLVTALMIQAVVVAVAPASASASTSAPAPATPAPKPIARRTA